MSTIEQVAQRSGVTAGTVSRILNSNSALYKSETRERVQLAARELGYQPNRLARSLATGQTHMVAVHVVWLHTQFYAKICDALERELSAHHYHMMFQKLPESVAIRGDAVPQPSWPVDGEIVVDGGPRFEGSSKAVFSPKRPLVSVGVYCLPDVDHVQIDVYQAATEAFEHLLSTGRRRIAYIVDEPTRQGTAEPMLRAYRDFMARTGQEPRFIIPAKRFPEDIDAAVRAHFQNTRVSERPDALFCHGDIVAHVALRVLGELAITVPNEVAIVGCGGGDETAFQSPSLTTIRFPVSQMSQLGWQLLQRRIDQPDAPIERVMLRAELVVRESSALASNDSLNSLVRPGPRGLDPFD